MFADTPLRVAAVVAKLLPGKLQSGLANSTEPVHERPGQLNRTCLSSCGVSPIQCRTLPVPTRTTER